MSKVVEMLKEKGIAERIQRNVDRSVALFGKDVPQEEIDKSVRIILDFDKAMCSAVDRLVKTICPF